MACLFLLHGLLSVGVAAGVGSTCGPVVTIVEPRPAALLVVEPSESEQNTHDVVLRLSYAPEAFTCENAADAPQSSMVVVADGYQRFEFTPPFPEVLFVSVRAGTHVLEASMRGQASEVSRTFFDVMPRGPLLTDGGAEHVGDHRQWLPPALARDCASLNDVDRQPPIQVRVVLTWLSV